MAFGETAFGEPVDGYRVRKTPGYLKTESKTVKGWLDALDGKFSKDFVGIAYNTSTREMRRLGRLAGSAVGVNPGDGLLGPVFQRIQRYTVQQNGTIGGAISKVDKRYYEDGGLVPLDGSDGDILVRFDEAYYLEQAYGDWLIWGVSDQAMVDCGFELAPPFLYDTAFFNGAYEGVLYNGELRSIARDPADGTSPVWPVSTRTGDWGSGGVSATIAKMEEWAKARGDNWGLVHFWDKWWRILLFRLRFASFNSQAMVGNGRSSLSGGSWENDSYIGRCGLGDELVGMFGSVSNGGTAGHPTDVNIIDGIENFGGNLWTGFIGMLMNNLQIYTKFLPPFPQNGVSEYTALTDIEGSNVVLTQGEGYLGEPRSGKAFMFDSAHDGASDVPVGDYCWSNNTGLRVGFSGAGSYSGSRVGVSALHLNSAPSYAYAYRGGRARFRIPRSA